MDMMKASQKAEHALLAKARKKQQKNSSPKYPSLRGVIRDMAKLLKEIKSGNIGEEEKVILSWFSEISDIADKMRGGGYDSDRG